MVGRMAALLVLFAALFFVVRAISRARRGLGPRLVTCPETKLPTIIEVVAGAPGVEGSPVVERYRIRECSRWPVRQDCEKNCLTQIVSMSAN